MSASESDIPESGEKLSKKNDNFKLLEISEIAELEQPKILDYVGVLHKLLNKKEKSLKKCKEKIKKLLKQVDKLKAAAANETQTTTNAELSATTPQTNDEATLNTAENLTSTASFVDEIRQAAEQAQSLSDFVYEPTSGLYYDQKTGYYYNAEYGLYYDGHTGCYYNYNQEKNSFEFHSQVEVQPNQNAAKNGFKNDVSRINYNDKYVNNTLLESFSQLTINRMRNNALGKQKDKNEDDKRDNTDDNDDLMQDVQFDEHGGVITDQEKLRKLRKEKRRKERELERAKRKKKKSKKSKDRKSKKDIKKSKKVKKPKRADEDSQSDGEKIVKVDMEDGELTESSTCSSKSSSSESESETDSVESSVPIFKSAGRFQDIAKKYPPSLRIIVQETNIESLKVGNLSLITFKGGSLGREGDHDVIIPDVNVSKSHLKFSYDHKSGLYRCIDLGSRNGTLLNGSRMSIAKVASEALELVHGSVLQIGQTKLLCHTHEGNSTCGLCEPGLLIETTTEREVSAPSVQLSHKEQLKKLQKKYGLENEKFVESNQGNTNNNYKDRAATRRIKVGSSSGKEKTQTASVLTAISSENKGFKMLSKLGWTEGEALGKSQANSGLLEPINVSSNEGKKGLGCEEPTAPVLSKADKKKMESVRKMQERYQKTTDIFTLNDDSN